MASRNNLFRAAATIACGALLMSAAMPARAQLDGELLAQARQLFQPLPASMAGSDSRPSPALLELGRDLFFDPRLSVDGTTSCARCHLPQLYGTDGLAKSHGNHDKLNGRNAPTVLNAALQLSAHWIGDRADVEDQATRSTTGPASMGNPDTAAVVARLKAVPGYAALFRQAFPGEAESIAVANAGKAIGAYERTLVTPSRFDAYLEGKDEALTPKQKSGLRKFIATGCATCHSGVGIGGSAYRKFGLYGDYWTATGSRDIDKGRVEFTKDAADTYVFRVASLRNVAMTAPYFHDGSVASLPEAVRIMARLQLDKTPSAADIEDIVAFLGSLTGSLPESFAVAPVLPPGEFAMPK